MWESTDPQTTNDGWMPDDDANIPSKVAVATQATTTTKTRFRKMKPPVFFSGVFVVVSFLEGQMSRGRNENVQQAACT